MLKRSDRISSTDAKKIANCVHILNTYTFRDLYRKFYDDPSFLLENPDDIASIFYWSYLAYNPEYVLQGLFRDDEICKNIAILEHQRKTPFLVITDLNDRLVISIRGTAMFKDYTHVLFNQSERIKIPERILSSYDLLERYNISLQSNKAFMSEQTHTGFVNHAFECLALIDSHVELSSIKKPIYCYGHSLGAFCAVFVARFLSLYKNRDDIHCYVLSCPKGLTGTFIESFPSAPIKYKHYYSKGDPVVEKTGIVSNKGKEYILYGEASENICLSFPFMNKDNILTPHSVYQHTSLLSESPSKSTNQNAIVLFERDDKEIYQCIYSQNNSIVTKATINVVYSDLEHIPSNDSYGGGKRKQKKRRTNDSFMYNGKRYVIYLGSKGGKYIKRNGMYISCSKLTKTSH